MMQTSQVLADLVGSHEAYTGNGGADQLCWKQDKLRKVAKHKKPIQGEFFLMQNITNT